MTSLNLFTGAEAEDESPAVLQKRNTKLIHKSDHAGERKPNLKNATELRKWAGITDAQWKSAVDTSQEWFSEHRVPDHMNGNSTAFKDFASPLYRLLYQQFESTHQSLEADSIDTFIWFCINRGKRNEKRNRVSRQSTPRSDPILPSLGSNQLNTVPELQELVTTDPEGGVCAIAWSSLCDEDSISMFGTWQDMVCEDFGITQISSIEYHRDDDHWQPIRLERHWVAAISFAVNEKKKAVFRINHRGTTDSASPTSKRKSKSLLSTGPKRSKVPRLEEYDDDEWPVQSSRKHSNRESQSLLGTGLKTPMFLGLEDDDEDDDDDDGLQPPTEDARMQSSTVYDESNPEKPEGTEEIQSPTNTIDASVNTASTSITQGLVNRDLPYHSAISKDAQISRVRHGNAEGPPAAPDGVVNKDKMDVDPPSNPATNNSTQVGDTEPPFDLAAIALQAIKTIPSDGTNTAAILNPNDEEMDVDPPPNPATNNSTQGGDTEPPSDLAAIPLQAIKTTPSDGTNADAIQPANNEPASDPLPSDTPVHHPESASFRCDEGVSYEMKSADPKTGDEGNPVDLETDETDPMDRIGIDEGWVLDDQNGDRIMAKIPTAVTEHLDEQRWKRCAELFLFDPAMTTPTQCIKVAGLRSKLYPYQIYGVFMMLEMEAMQGGGYLADGMGLGKTIEILALITFSRRLGEAWRDVRSAWKENDQTKHLARTADPAMSNEEVDDKVCPSSNRFGIQCPCVRKGVARHLHHSKGPTLLLLPPAILPQWLSEFWKHVDVKDKISRWTIRCAHSASARASNIAKPTAEDYQYLDPDKTKDGPASGFICFTTAASYAGQLEETMAHVETLPNGYGGTRKQVDAWPLQWARIIVDEAHKETTMLTKGSKIAGIYPNTAKWFVTGTPFERGPSQMQCWLSRIFAGDWNKIKVKDTDYWPNLEERTRGWKAVKAEELLALNKTHTKMVDGDLNQIRRREINAHLDQLKLILKTWWIQRDAEKSRFFGQPLVILPKRTHQNILCRLPKRYQDALNTESGKINLRIFKKLAHTMKEWKKHQRGAEPAPKIGNWLNEHRRLRIVTSFPALQEIHATQDLTYSWSEDYNSGWVKREPGELYRLVETHSPYEENIHAITNPATSAKTKALRSMLATVWDNQERAVIVTMGPTVALILYWYLRLVREKSVALIDNKMPKAVVADICGLFNDDPMVKDKYPNEPLPQYLVGTTRLLGTGYNLTGARRLVIFDPEWMQREQDQAIHRIYRIGQKLECFTYCFQTEGSDLEEAIWQRQAKRNLWIQMCKQAGLTGPSLDVKSTEPNPDDIEDEDPGCDAV